MRIGGFYVGEIIAVALLTAAGGAVISILIRNAVLGSAASFVFGMVFGPWALSKIKMR